MTPTKTQKVAKAKFWQRIKANPALLPDEMDDATMARVSGCLDIQLVLKKPDFRDWFLDTSINQAMIEVGVCAAIERLIAIVEMSGSDLTGKDAEAKAGDQVRAAALLLQYAGYGVAGKDTSVSEVAKMSETELDAFISSKVKRLKKMP
jgi:hypothetical protein